MSLNQDIRVNAPSGDPNNPQGLYNYLIVGQNLKGTGIPDNNLGTINSSYIDEATGIQYIKGSDATWTTYIDYTAIGPTGGAPPTIPDPLTVNQINTDVISQKTLGGDLSVNLGLTGDFALTLGVPTQAVDINSGNIRLTANGNGTFSSDVQGYTVIANNGSGKAVSINSNSGIIDHVGAQPLEITNSQPNENLILSTTGAAGDVLVNSGGDVAIGTAVAGKTIDLNTNAGAINCDAVNTNFIDTSGSGAIAINPLSGIAAATGAGSFSITNFTASQDILFQLNGGDIDANNNEIKNVSSINGSSALVNNSILNVNTSGSLAWRAYPRCIEMQISGFGANGTDYFNLGTTVVGPADFWGVCSGNGRRLAEVDVRLLYNTAWSFGGGTATLEIGYVPNGSPMIAANFVVLRSINLDTATPLYGVSFTGYNDSIPFRAAICARTVLAGTASTSGTAEFTLGMVLV